MLLPWLRQLDPFWLKLLVIVELALPLYLLLGVMLVRFFVVEKLNWDFPLLVPLIVTIIPAVTALHERFLGASVFFAVIYLVSFVVLGMREHILFYDCALPFVPSHGYRWPFWLMALQVFWFLQAPAAAFNGLNWPRGLLWTQSLLAAVALVVWLGLIVFSARARQSRGK